MNWHPLRRAVELLRFLVGRDPRHVLLRIALAAALFGSGAFVYVWLGFAPIAASRGHWPATQWFLGFAMRNAVETRSMLREEPPLDTPGLVLKGAGHYATGCAPCHGAPGQARSPIVLQLVPEAPVLQPLLQRWKAQELFWIVRHGLKYTAMPGWSADDRTDEVWALVAFLRAMPRMSPQRYRWLAYAEPEGASEPIAQGASDLRTLWGATGATLADCARCHGADGNGRGPGTIPKLAGQSQEYLLASLTAFAGDQRHSGIMRPIAAALDAATMRRMAAHYAALPRSAIGPAEVATRATAVARTLMQLEDPKGRFALGALDAAQARAAIARGAVLAARGDEAGSVPACAHCHGPGGAARNPVYPELAGQPPEYLALQLALFRQGARGGTAWQELMHQASAQLSAAQIRDLALFYAAQPPRR